MADVPGDLAVRPDAGEHRGEERVAGGLVAVAGASLPVEAFDFGARGRGEVVAAVEGLAVVG